MIAHLIFWLSLIILFHSYLGYALIAAVIARFRGKVLITNCVGDEFFPEVTMVVPAFNEIDFLEKKISNCLTLDYDQDKLIFVFITDGSNDGSAEFISRYPRIRLMHEPERKGKAAAINRVMKEVSGEIVIFSDANTLLNRSAVREIIKHYRDEKVGGVAGEKKVSGKETGKAVSAGEGFYWTYESWLKSVDSKFYSVVGAAGELFSLRRQLYTPLPDDTVLDDFVMSLTLCLAGFVVRYEPAAFATESASVSIAEEKKRKVRISSGGFQAIGRLKPLFNFVKFPALTYLYVSHRVFRWTVCPFLLPVAFITNYLIARGSLFYQLTFTAQLLIYFLALLGSLLASRRINVKLFFVPYYFVFMNWSLIQGLFTYLFLKPTVLWEKARRSV